MGGRVSIRQRGIRSQQPRWQYMQWSGTLAVIVALGALGSVMQAEEVSVADLLSQAQSAYRVGETQKALSLANQAVERDPKDPKGFYVRGWLHEMQRRHRQAIADYDAVIKLDPSAVEVYKSSGEASTSNWAMSRNPSPISRKRLNSTRGRSLTIGSEGFPTITLDVTNRVATSSIPISRSTPTTWKTPCGTFCAAPAWTG